MQVLTVVFALAAACSNAIRSMVQHAASIDIPKKDRGVRAVAFLFRQPLWLLGWLAAVGGFVFQALALHNGLLSVVQPLLVTELVFALVFRQFWIGQDVAPAAWTSAVVVCGSLAVFLLMAEPHGGHPTPDTAEWLSCLLTFGGIVAVLTVLAMRGSPVRRAALYAAAAAISWALMAVFIKATTDVLTSFGVVGMLERWPVYALAACGIAGTVLQQAALQSGPLSVSQPVLIVVDPAVAIILSVWLFDERFTGGTWKTAMGAAAFAVMAAGVVALSRTAPADLAPAQPARPAGRTNR
ncbi:MAG TPA: DMT family transporter [Acidimicrobiales bacterium]|nr:DMT family transporter [Acidimicrobiales bacterium]